MKYYLDADGGVIEMEYWPNVPDGINLDVGGKRIKLNSDQVKDLVTIFSEFLKCSEKQDT